MPERKNFATAEKDSSDHAGTEITCEIGADRDVGKPPDHRRVGEADGEGSGRGRDEGA